MSFPGPVGRPWAVGRGHGLGRARDLIESPIERDLAALTPLIWEHVNPYGRFELDMDARITALE